MNLSDKMKDWSYNVQTGMTRSSTSLLRFWIRVISGLMIGLTIALVAQEMLEFGYLSLSFMTLVMLGLFLRISKNWSFLTLIVVDLMFVLICQILKMYIMVAP